MIMLTMFGFDGEHPLFPEVLSPFPGQKCFKMFNCFLDPPLTLALVLAAVACGGCAYFNPDPPYLGEPFPPKSQYYPYERMGPEL